MNIVIGLGNFGCRTLKAQKNTNISDATLIACDTDIRQKELQETDGIVTSDDSTGGGFASASTFAQSFSGSSKKV